MKKLLTVAEASAYLRVSRGTLYTLMKKGEIKSLKIGGKRLFLESELIAYIEKQEKAEK